MDIYSTTSIAGLVTVQMPFVSFFLQRFFPTIMVFDKEEIAFDKIIKDQRLAPFVSPFVKGRVNKKTGSTTQSFKPAYLKPLDDVRPTDIQTRMPGEAIGGARSLQDKFDDALADVAMDQDQQIDRRKEVMAVETLMTGKVVMEGPDYPKQEIDFGRDPSLDITLAGTDKWDDVASDPCADLESWSGLIRKKCGSAGSDVVMTDSVWNKLRKNKEFRDQLDTKRGISEIPNIDPRVAEVVQYKGMWGQFHLWTYGNSYEDMDGNTVDVMSGNKLLMVAVGQNGLRGVQAHGAIYDIKAGLQPLEKFYKMWEENDPSVMMCMTQSAPLMVPAQINASLVVEVF